MKAYPRLRETERDEHSPRLYSGSWLETGCSAGVAHSSGGRVVAGSNPVIPNNRFARTCELEQHSMTGESRSCEQRFDRTCELEQQAVRPASPNEPAVCLYDARRVFCVRDAATQPVGSHPKGRRENEAYTKEPGARSAITERTPGFRFRLRRFYAVAIAGSADGAISSFTRLPRAIARLSIA